MASSPPIPIPAEFDTLDLIDKRAYLTALRERLEQSLGADESQVEEALFAEIARRKAGHEEGTRRSLSREELMQPLRAAYE